MQRNSSHIFCRGPTDAANRGCRPANTHKYNPTALPDSRVEAIVRPGPVGGRGLPVRIIFPQTVPIGPIEHESRSDDSCLPGPKWRWKEIIAFAYHYRGFQVLPPSRVRYNSLQRPPFARNRRRRAVTQYRQLVLGGPSSRPAPNITPPMSLKMYRLWNRSPFGLSFQRRTVRWLCGKDGVWHGRGNSIAEYAVPPGAGQQGLRRPVGAHRRRVAVGVRRDAESSSAVPLGRIAGWRQSAAAGFPERVHGVYAAATCGAVAAEVAAGAGGAERPGGCLEGEIRGQVRAGSIPELGPVHDPAGCADPGREAAGSEGWLTGAPSPGRCPDRTPVKVGIKRTADVRWCAAGSRLRRTGDRRGPPPAQGGGQRGRIHRMPDVAGWRRRRGA